MTSPLFVLKFKQICNNGAYFKLKPQQYSKLSFKNKKKIIFKARMFIRLKKKEETKKEKKK